jgi:hypothetical protein
MLIYSRLYMEKVKSQGIEIDIINIWINISYISKKRVERREQRVGDQATRGEGYRRKQKAGGRKQEGEQGKYARLGLPCRFIELWYTIHLETIAKSLAFSLDLVKARRAAKEHTGSFQ